MERIWSGVTRAVVVEVVEVKALGYRCDAAGKEDTMGKKASRDVSPVNRER